MFIGHFAAGFAAKRAAPGVSLGILFLAAQLPDLLWPTFLLLGIEQVRIVPGATAVTPLVFEHYPISHSLLAVLAWALVMGSGYWLLRRHWRGAILLGILVISHWVLDALVHQPDLPLLPWSSSMVGLNGWTSLPVTLAIESMLFACGVWLYLGITAPRDATGHWWFVGLVLALLVIYAGNLFGGPPPNVTAIALAGQLQWVLILWGTWIDKHRQLRLQIGGG